MSTRPRRAALRRVEFAVGFTDHTWSEFSILVPERTGEVLSDAALRKKAETMADRFEFSDKEISFRTVIHIEPPNYAS